MKILRCGQFELTDGRRFALKPRCPASLINSSAEAVLMLMRFSVSCGGGNGSMILAELVPSKLSKRKSATVIVTYCFNVASLELGLGNKISWPSGRRIDETTFFARIRDGKFLIEEDWTEDGIATELIEAGVPKEDIVLAFHEPEMRGYTEFAAA